MSKFVKIFLALSAALCMLFVFAACEDLDINDGDNDGDTKQADKTTESSPSLNYEVDGGGVGDGEDIGGNGGGTTAPSAGGTTSGNMNVDKDSPDKNYGTLGTVRPY